MTSVTKNQNPARFINFKDDKFLLIIYFITFIFAFFNGPIETNDSKGYEHMFEIRSVGYPLYLKISTLFGLIPGYYSSVIISSLVGIFAVHYLTNYLKLQFNLSKLSIFAVTIILITPNFSLFIPNFIDSEAIAYPLFLIMVRLFLKSAFEKNSKSAIFYLLITAALITIRAQFTFMHAISGLLILYILWYSKTKRQDSFRLIAVFILTVISIPLSDRTFHYIVHHRFTETPFTGVQLLTPALYNITPKDTQLFANDPIAIGLIDTVVKCLNANEVYSLKFNSADNSENTVYKYSKLYVPLEFKYSNAYVLNAFRKQGNKDMDLYVNVDKFNMSMALKLIKAHPDKYFKLYFLNINASLGSRIFMIAFFTLFGFGFVLFFKTKSNGSIFFVFTCIFVLLNLMLVNLLEAPLIRYYFYQDYLFFTLFAIVIIKFAEDQYNKITIKSTGI